MTPQESQLAKELSQALCSLNKQNGNGNKTITKWTLGAMFTLIIIFATAAFGMMSDRISVTEADLKERTPLITEGAVKLEGFEKWQGKIDQEVKVIGEAVIKNSNKLDGVLGQMDILLKQVLPERRNPTTR